MAKVNYVGKVVELKFKVKGASASIIVDGVEKRNVVNDGLANIYFPLDFNGTVKGEVRGSKSGVDAFEVTI